MYILDEPSIGLHQRDNERLLRTLSTCATSATRCWWSSTTKKPSAPPTSLIDIGPGAGVHGGEDRRAGVFGRHTAKQSARSPGSIFPAKDASPIPNARTPIDADKMLTLDRRSGNNLQRRHRRIPCGLLTCVTGVSGSGKSTLINQTLYPIAASRLQQGAPRCDAHALRPLEGSTTWTRSSTSTRAQSAARRAPIRPRTRGCSRRSASFSRRRRKPAPAATSPAVSASTSKAGAARHARATA